MIELWARGNNIWRQLEFSPLSSSTSASASAPSDAAEAPRIGGDGWGERDEEEEEEEIEPRDLKAYGKVFEADSVEWVGSDGFGCVGMFCGVSFLSTLLTP